MYIEKINSPADVKKLSIEQCGVLASEIRTILLNKISEVGGHLGPNLGSIEAIIAYHYVFNSPRDQIVFDVSHQSYPHKMLTGRKAAYMDPKLYATITGFTEPSESIYDLFTVGHTSTSLSLACGLAKARDLLGGHENVVAFIGDGSLGGGEAFEGLNFAGSELNSNFIVMLNDNNKSIADNRGGLYRNLKALRESNGKSEPNFFKTLGYDYLYVQNGNDVGSLVAALRKVKDCDHPVVVHFYTVKGCGYKYAEEHQEQTHAVKPFFLGTGLEKQPYVFREGVNERYDYIIRDHLIEKMKADPAVAVIMAATMYCLSFNEDKRKEAGKQFIDTGSVEEHAVAMAAGMARNGGKPVFATASTFINRAYDQIQQELCINKCAATLIIVNASAYAIDDVTHTEILDIAMLSNIPNLVYLAPTNKEEYLAMLDWSIDQTQWPVAIRQPRNGVFHAKGSVDKDYSRLNTYKVERKGSVVAIIAVGEFFQLGEQTCDLLEKENVHATLINPRFISGLDVNLLTALKANHTLVVTLESGSLSGGFGEKVAGFYGTDRHVQVLCKGLRKAFPDTVHVKPAEILKKQRLEPEQISQDILELLKARL